jgi:UDP-N-acetylglucosamine 2-epimerase
MRVFSFVGTRPEIIKNLALCRAAQKFPTLDFRVVHTGQNFGPEMADGFFDELRIPLFEQNSAFDRSSLGAMARSLIDFMVDNIIRHKPDIIISNTDTTTAFYTAFAGAQLRVPVAHIEGGIRCEARWNPEEINRKLADHLSQWVFTISEGDSAALRAEGFPVEQIYMLGDITLDALQIVLREHGIEVCRGDYNVLTVHRQENTNDPNRLRAIVAGVEKAGVKTIFPVHPRTQESLVRFGLWQDLLASPVITVGPPQAYLDIVRLLAGCGKLLSDSGGLRREGYMLGKPVIALVDFVWFPQMHELGFAFGADADASRITWAIKNFSPNGPRPPLFGDGHAGEYILRTLLKTGSHTSGTKPIRPTPGT